MQINNIYVNHNHDILLVLYGRTLGQSLSIHAIPDRDWTSVARIWLQYYWVT